MSAKCYIAGPMEDCPDLNHPAFAEAAATLRRLGFEVVSPAELNPITTRYRDAMITDIKALLECDHICLLEGWERSQGAVLERHIAQVLGIVPINLDGGK